MYQKEFNKIVADPAQLMEIEMVDIRSMSERYPYCQLTHIFYAKKLHDLNNTQFDNQLKKASISVYDRNVLYQFIEKSTFNKPVHAGFDEENERPFLLETAQELIETNEKGPEIDQRLTEQNIPMEVTTSDSEQVILPVEEKPEELSKQEELTEAPEMELQEVTEISESDEDKIIQELMNSIPELVSENIEIQEPEFDAEEKDIDLSEEYAEMKLEAIAEADQQSESPEQDPLTIMEKEFTESELEILNMEPEFEPSPEMEPEVSESETEQIIQDLMQSVPELNTDLQEIPELALRDETTESFELPEELEEMAIESIETTITQNEIPELDPLAINMDAMLEMEDETISEDELIFELPPYDIESELGPLPEDQKINISIQRPVFEEKSKEEEEVFADSFVGWLNRLGGQSKGIVVARKESNRPVRLYSKKQQQEEPTPFQKQPEKVIDEMYAGELAKKSLQADEHLVTETYARILVMQGKYPKAVEMYSKLSLLKPQKSDYFAALIDQLKKRIK